MSITERMQNLFPIEGLFRDSTYENPLTNFVREHHASTTRAFDLGRVLSITAVAATGIAAVVAITTATPVLGFGAGTYSLISGSGLISLGAMETVRFPLLNLIVPPHHSMSQHAYSPGEYEGSKLYYQGNVPILSLDYTSSFKAGEAHGYLCGAGISSLAWRSMFSMNRLLGLPRADQVKETLAEVREKIPPQYLEEMNGLVLGYNKWVQEQPSWKCHPKLTADDFLLLHLTPDSLHFQPKKFEDGLKESTSPHKESTPPLLTVGCSVIVDRDAKGEWTFARNMDWPSGGVAGTYSLIINRCYKDGRCDTAEVGFPGLIGTLTGMNDQGVCLAMNVCRGDTGTIEGMPAVFYNRTCLEEKRSVQKITESIQKEAPLGPYHLNIADKETAAAIHFYQLPNGGHVIRPYQNGPLATFNHYYSPKPIDEEFVHNKERKEVFDEFCQKRDQKPIETALSLKYIDNRDTVHTVVMHPSSRSFEVAFDNSFAAENSLHPIDTTQLFSRAEG
ncbi:MAG TPA: C45 family peptidase [Candidatus Rhabdochlamydia sp.]|nr:C45 family peptidase [Candidatus Rhabdochlamydia sp.]